MAIPVAHFTYVIQGLQISFTDTSSEDPTGWQWDFGNGYTSILQNPTHLFTDPGVYQVTLTATNSDGDSDPYTRTIQLFVPTTLYVNDFIQADLPEGLTIDPSTQTIWIQKWQLHLQILIDPHIPNEFVHNDSQWPNLVNALIAKLVIHDAFTRAAAGAMVLMMQGASGSGESSHSSPGGQEKSIETGPTRVEWFNVADSISSFMRNSGGESGASVFDILRQQICRLAARLRVKLPHCRNLPQNTIIPIKAEFPKTARGLQVTNN